MWLLENLKSHMAIYTHGLHYISIGQCWLRKQWLLYNWGKPWLERRKVHDLKLCLHWKCPLNRQPMVKNTQTSVRKSPCHQRQKLPLLAVSLGHRHHSKNFLWVESLHLHNCPMKAHLSYRWGDWGTQRCTCKWDLIFGNLTSDPDPYQFCDPSRELSFLDELSEGVGWGIC